MMARTRALLPEIAHEIDDELASFHGDTMAQTETLHYDQLHFSLGSYVLEHIDHVVSDWRAEPSAFDTARVLPIATLVEEMLASPDKRIRNVAEISICHPMTLDHSDFVATFMGEFGPLARSALRGRN